MVVRSFGAVTTIGATALQPVDTYHRPSVFDSQALSTYANIYRTQPEVRTVVDFLARNIAQLGLHAFRRRSDTDRERISGHELVQWIEKPNPGTTRYRLIEALMQDMGIYFNAYWLKVRMPNRIGLVRLPPEQMTVVGTLLPEGFIFTKVDGTEIPLGLSELVYFNGYDPCDPLMGLSPLETLRKTLSEEAASLDYRQAYWDHAARLEGVISRPREAPKWTPDQKQAFREQWQTRYSGHPGQTAILEDGMTFTQATAPPTFIDSEYTAARKMTREEVAAAYHVPLPMVGILDHATFSNIREQHKQLYQDCLGPWNTMIVEELERQLLPECDDQTDVYFEFNINEKLKGSFEEQAASIRSLVGRPIMTANEGRARLNLPAITDDPTADALALPLNTGTGTQAGEPTPVPAAATVPVIRRTWMRQRARLDKLPIEERAHGFEVDRWNRELAAELEPLYRAVGYDEADAAHQAAALAATINGDTLQLLVAGEQAFSSGREAALYG
jgi:HK97 family phage portal protein